MDFLDNFTLFGMGGVVLVIAVVEGIKAVAQNIGKALTPVATVVICTLVSWGVLAMIEAVNYLPGSEPYVKGALAAILMPLSAMGVYSGIKNAVGGLVSMTKAPTVQHTVEHVTVQPIPPPPPNSEAPPIESITTGV
jgi:hypothetical protein